MAGDALSLLLFPLRTGLNIAALLAIGLALHGALGVVERPALKTLRSTGLGATVGVIVFALARLAMLNLQMGDGASLFDPDMVALSWIALGPSTLALLVGAAVIAASLLLAPSRILMAAGSFLLAAGFALTGHSQGLTDPGFAPPAVALHVLIAGYWVVAPITLFPRGSLANDQLHARLAVFSRWAIGAIPVLIALGVWLAWRIAGGLAPLLNSNYGRLLLLKLAVALAAMAMGALNKQVITGKVLADPPTGRRWLRWTLGVESSLFLVAVVAVSAATTIGAPGE